jgi:hypothetical protein
MEEDLNLFFNSDDFGKGSDTIGEDMGSRLYDALEQILEKRFGESSKKKEIKNISKGYKIACPYCGDSDHDDSKKRGTLYLEDNSYKCWNGGCGVYRPINVFLEDWGSDSFTISEKESLSVKHVISNSSNKKSLADFYNKDIMFDKDLLISKLKSKDIDHSLKGYNYLKSRNAHILTTHDMAYNDYYNNLIFLNMFEDKVIGIQVRLSNPFNGSRFISYNYNDIQEKLLELKDYDKEFAKQINKVSLIYNILNVNFQLPVNVFESTLDSKYFPNSIAIWGANNELKIPNGYYFFDNDDAGRKIAMGYMDTGHNVFLWKKFLKDYPVYEGVKDINDIYKKNIKFNNKVMYDYFGSGIFDKYWL